MQGEKKLSVKDFIKQRKVQVKNSKNKQQQTDNLTQYIQNGDIENFKTAFMSIQNQQIVYYLFSEDSMKNTPLMKILMSDKIEQFLKITNDGLQRDFHSIEIKICLKWSENQLIANDWKNKISSFNKFVVKQIMKQKDLKSRCIFSQIVVKEFSKNENFISNLYKEFLTFDLAIENFPTTKNYSNLLQLVEILECFYIPLCESLWVQAGSDLKDQFIELRKSKIKENIWNTKDFATAIKQNQLNDFSYELKELSINFMHQLFLDGKLPLIVEAHQLLASSKNQDDKKLIKKACSQFDSNQHSPIDIALKSWSFKQISQIFMFVTLNQQTMRFSTNSINIVLQNPKLDQFQKEQLIKQILCQKHQSQGYIESVKVEEQVDLRKENTKNKIHVNLATNQFSSIVVYDTKPVIQKKFKNSYPLIAYLDKYREKSNLKVVQKLFINDILDKKLSKLKIMTTIKCFWKNESNLIQQNSSGYKQLQQLLFYHTPLIYLLCRMNPCDCSEYLLSKLFINCPELYFKRHNETLQVEISRHFLVIYLENSPNLEENPQNKQILQRVFESKESQRFIGQKYNLYLQLLKALNQGSVFKKHKNDCFMVNQVRSYLRQYFDSIISEDFLNADYLKELSFRFLSYKMQNSKISSKLKYNIEEDWSLYTIDELCSKIDLSSLNNMIQSKQIELQVNNFSQNQLKKNSKIEIEEQNKINAQNISKQKDPNDDQNLITEKQRILKLISNYKNGISEDYQTKLQICDLSIEQQSVSWFKTKHHIYQSYISLKKYIQKLNSQRSIQGQNPSAFMIQLSLYENDLQEKIQLLMQEGYNFYFRKKEVDSINLRNEESCKTFLRLFQSNEKEPDSNKQIKSQSLVSVINRMIRKETDFITALLFCKEDQTEQLKSIFSKKGRELFLRNLMEKFSQRNESSLPRIAKNFAYPHHAIEPIPFHVFVLIKKIVSQRQLKDFEFDVVMRKLLNNFFSNLQNKILDFSQIKNFKINDQEIQSSKENAIKDLVSLWQEGHKLIKEKLHYDEFMQTLIQQQVNRQFIIQREQKNCEVLKQVLNYDAFNIHYLLNEHLGTNEEQKMEQKYSESSEIFCLKEYYLMLGQKLLQKYHNKSFDFGDIFKKLSIQQVFIIDGYLSNRNNYGTITTYYIQKSELPGEIIRKRIQIQPFLKPLKQNNNDSRVKRIFIQSLKRLSNEQFLEILPITLRGPFVQIGDILNQIDDEEKMICLLDFIYSSRKDSNTLVLSQNYLISIMKENRPRFSISVLLIVEKSDFKFWINEDTQKKEVKKIACDNITFYSKCNMKTFDIVLGMIKKYYKKSTLLVSPQTIRKKSQQIIKSLVETSSWQKLIKLLNTNDFDNFVPFIESVFAQLGQNLLSLKQSFKIQTNKDNFQRILATVFQKWKELNAQFKEQIFTKAFQCSPQKSIEIMNPARLSVQGLVICLKQRPEHANLFLQNEIQVNTEQPKPSAKYFRDNFPLIPYYYHKFGDCPWLLDLLRVERKILRSVGEIQRLDKTMQSLILLDKMEDNFSEFYSEEQIMIKCQKILTSNTIKSIKKYPQDWFIKFFAGHKLKTYSIQTEQLLIQLIDLQYIKKDSIVEIISTCKMEVIKMFLQKHSIELNLQTLKQIEINYLNVNKYRKSLWEFLTQIQNEAFVVDFIRTFKLLDVYPVKEYEDILLTNIACFKRIHLLSFIIEHFTHKCERKLEFVFNKKGKIQHYLLVLPEEISISMNFYQYYFLVKSCDNQCPQFCVSNRFLIEAQNQQEQLQKLDFVPQLKKRLQILHILSRFIPVSGESISWKKNVLLKELLTLKEKKQITDEKPNHEVGVNLRWQSFLKYVVEPSPQLFKQKPIGLLGQLLVLYIVNSKVGILPEQLQRLYPVDIKIIKSIDKYLNKEINLLQQAKSIIKDFPQLKSIVLVNNFDQFIQSYEEEFKNISKIDDAIMYIKGVLINLETLELTEEKYQAYLQNYLNVVFCRENQHYLASSHSNLMLRKYILEFMLVSYSKGSKFAFNHLSKLLNLSEQSQGQEGRILFLTALKVNEKSIKGGSAPSFDVRAWTNVINQISEIKSQTKSIKKEFQLEQFIKQSVKSLSDQLRDRYSSQVTNLEPLILDAVGRAQKVRSKNVFLLVTILLNETYILSSFYEFYRQIKKAMNISEDKCLKLTIKFNSEQQFSAIVSPSKSEVNESINPQISFLLPYQWTIAQQSLPLIHFDISSSLNQSQKQILLQKIKEDPQIKELTNQFFQVNGTNFKKCKFYLDYQSLLSVKKCESLKKLTLYLPLTDNGISMVQKVLNEIDDKAFIDKTIPYYSLSDVYGPIKLNDSQSNTNRVIDCLTFYQLTQLPLQQSVVITLINEKPSEQQCSDRYVEDFEKYISYMTNEITDSHPADRINHYNFNSKIYLHIDEESQQISIFTHEFSLINILRCLCLVSSVSDEIRRLFQSRIDVRFNVRSIIGLYKALLSRKRQESQNFNTSNIMAQKFIKTLLKSKENSHLIEKMLMMIIEDAINVMKALKGAIISYNVVQKSQSTQLYQIYDSVYISTISYSIQDQIFCIQLNVIIEPNASLIKTVSLSESNLISRKHFLSEIFSSTQFMTDYFLQKNQINNECIKISRKLTTNLNKTINLHVNYKSLYTFIDQLKNQVSTKEIDGYLYVLRTYLLANLQKKLLEYSGSQDVQDRHQILLFNTFEYLHQSLSRGIKINEMTIENDIEKLYHEKEIRYLISSVNSNTGLTLIEGYSQQISNLNESAKSVFFLQIFKSYFTTLVTEGMTFIIGFKQQTKPPILIKFIKREDIDKINLNEVSYMLLLSSTIPSSDELDHRKIINLFISDLYKNIYKVSEVIKNYLLELNQSESELRNISNLLPVIPSNVVVDFQSNKNENQTQTVLKDKKDTKVFEMKIEKQPKFKLVPSQSKSISMVNYLKKNSQFRKQLNRFVQNISKTWKCPDLEIIIDTSKIPKEVNLQKIAQIIRLSFFDIDSALSSYLAESLRNSELQTYYSIQFNKSVKENIFLQFRKALFLNQFKSIRIQISQTENPHLRIQQNEIVLELSFKGEHKFIKDKDILYEILKFLVDEQLKKNGTLIVLENKSQLQIGHLMNALDISNTLSIQIKQIEKAICIYDILKIGESFKTFKPLIVLQKDKKTQISCTQCNKTLLLQFNLSHQENQFFTSSKILTLMMSKFQHQSSPYQHRTYFDFKQKSINIVGTLNDRCQLVIQSEGKLMIFKQKITRQGPLLLGKISVFKTLQDLKLSSSSSRYWLVDTDMKQSYSNFIYSLPQQKAEQNKFICKKIHSISTNQSISLFVKGQDSSVSMNTCPITISILQPNDSNNHTYQSILRDQFKDNYEVQMISKQVAKFDLIFNSSLNVSINLGTLQNILDQKRAQTCQLTVNSDHEAVIEHTKFIEVHFRNKVQKSKQIKSNENKKPNSEKTFLQPAQKVSNSQEIEGSFQKGKKFENIENLVYVVNNQSKNYLTRAGQKRVDYIQVCDAELNPIQYKGEVNFFFKHINNLCKIVPQIQPKGLKIGLAWTPTIRGHYKAFFNGICLNPDYEIGVCAAVADPSLSTIQKPKVTQICFVQETECTFNLKDCFGNIYTELEQTILGDGLLIDIEASNENVNKFLKKKQQTINKYGAKKVRFSIDDVNGIQSVKSMVTVSLNKQKMCEFQLSIEGQSLLQRKKNLQKQVNALNKGFYKEILVSRSNFVESLFKIAQKSLLTNFSVKFNGQQGIDAGGLKREFYDMIGNEMKSQNNPFFKATNAKKNFYFINPQVLKNKKKEKYMELFGKYIANSILNSYLVGINFSSVFIKLLYSDPVYFEDLCDILPEEEANRYKYLTYAQESEFQDLEIYFSVTADKKKGKYIELKQDGSNIQVNQYNVKEYLDLLTKTLVQDRYKQVVDALRQGFESVIPLTVVRKWIRPHEFWCLTQGTKELNAQIVLNSVVFSGNADESMTSWFRRYINEATPDVLEGFLKFTSGSSSIDFDQTSKLTVTFENTGVNTKKLPISHTCWKQIIVPKYKTYEIMHKLLNAAFIFCSEGFGFS